MTKDEKLQRLGKVFSPIAPIKTRDLFFGRIQQIQNVCDAINEPGQHAILYGERGVGKTSLGNIMSTQLTNVYPVKVTCSRDDDFKSLWLRAFQNIPLAKTTSGIGFTKQDETHYISISSRVAQIEDVLPANIEELLKPVLFYRILFVFDEFDNINKNKVREQFADLIKSLSDNCENITIVIIGISENVVNLLGNHQSLERCLKQIKMPRMNPSELAAIIENGLSSLEIDMNKETKKKIIEFSAGFPHYTHLLCKFGCKLIIEDDKSVFNKFYLDKSITLAIDNVQEQIREAYRKATFSSAAESQWSEVLFACAISEPDEFNCFTIKEITKKYGEISGKEKNKININYNLGKLCQKERGMILEKLEIDGSVKFRFTNPLSKAFVILKMNQKPSSA